MALRSLVASSGRWNSPPLPPSGPEAMEWAFRPVPRYSTMSSRSRRPDPHWASPVRSGANQPCSDSAGQRRASLSAPNSILGRMAGAAMAGAVHQIGAAVPVRALARRVGIGRGTEEQHVPAAHHEAQVEGEVQLVDIDLPLHRPDVVQIIPQRRDVAVGHMWHKTDRAWPDRAACRPARCRPSSPGGNPRRCNCRCRFPCPGVMLGVTSLPNGVIRATPPARSLP